MQPDLPHDVEEEVARVVEESWLGVQQARVLLLRQRGCTHAEIARMLGITTTASQSILYDVRQRYLMFSNAVSFLSNEFPEVLGGDDSAAEAGSL